MKLQDAFVVEANAVGSWQKIGYTMQNSNNFNYAGAFTGTVNGSTMLASISAATEGWSATATAAKMNDCQNGVWKVLFNKSSDDTNPVTYSATANSAACQMLSTSLEQLTRGNYSVATGG